MADASARIFRDLEAKLRRRHVTVAGQMALPAVLTGIGLLLVHALAAWAGLAAAMVWYALGVVATAAGVFACVLAVAGVVMLIKAAWSEEEW